MAKYKPRIQGNAHRTCFATLAWQNTEVFKFKNNFLLFILYFIFDSQGQGICWVSWRYCTELDRPRGRKPKLPSCHLSALPIRPCMSFYPCCVSISCHHAACGLGQCELAFLPPCISWIQQESLMGPFSCAPCGNPPPGRTEASCIATIHSSVGWCGRRPHHNCSEMPTEAFVEDCKVFHQPSLTWLHLLIAAFPTAPLC